MKGYLVAGIKDTKHENSYHLYWIGVVVLLLFNAAAIFGVLRDPNAIVLMVLVINAVVFISRGAYAIWHRNILFSDANYRDAEAASNAERVGVYVFVVLMSAAVMLAMLDDNVNIDDSAGEVGEQLMLLVIIAPVLTYLTSGYGKFREIVERSKSQEAE